MAVYARRLARFLVANQAQPSVLGFGASEHAAGCTAPCLSAARLCSTASLESATPASAPITVADLSTDADLDYMSLTPTEIVDQLDRNIVGQGDAKRAVANALRNRWRRHRIPSPLKEEIVPKNILMIGPTGCGKTEIARRLAKLADAPFVKVEATKFTEVGFHGRDVDSIIRDLVDNAILLTKQNVRKKMQKEIAQAVEDRIVDALIGPSAVASTKDNFRNLYRTGQLEQTIVEIEVPKSQGIVELPELGMGLMAVRKSVMQLTGQKDTEKRRLTVEKARPVIEETEINRIESSDSVVKDALVSAEQDGIVFIDEIDKIVSPSNKTYGADASSEGVQRDLLPIIEGSVINTKQGNVKTDHMLFICSGAFHACKPSDMLAELQGRLPIRVELKGLTAGDFYRILTEPEHNMLKQQEALLQTEGIELVFTDAAVKEIARVAEEANTLIDNIGARRLYTIIERIIDEISFKAPEIAKQKKEDSSSDGSPTRHVIDKADVQERIGDLLKKQDLSKFIL